jgi:peptide chain release factor 2
LTDCGRPSFSSATLFDAAGKEEERARLDRDMQQPGFWDDPARANEVVARAKALKAALDPFAAFAGELDDAEALADLADEEGDADAAAEAGTQLEALAGKLDALETRTLLDGPDDHRNAYLAVQAGAGGTESCDWAQMLIRMYTRWAEAHGHAVKMMDANPGEEAGIKSATLHIQGDAVYGYLKVEAGVHRLVRISPFDAAKRRHTSFASVDVSPEVDEAIDVEILDKDLRVDTYRSSGAGGQHVNVTDSAVRITHLPTGIVAQCQSERSQHKNRGTAMKLLRARLYRIEEEKKAAERAKERGEKREIAWGSQIRSYVLQPYTMVKDHRTDAQEGNTQGVLDGRLDNLLQAALRWQKSLG